MSDPNVFLAALAGVSLVVSIPVAIYASYKSFVAKTFTEQIKFTALFVIPILITFALGELAGITRFPRFSDVPETAPSATELFSKMPAMQIALLAVAAIIWIVGNKLLLDSHKKRTGKSWWDIANPFKPHFGDYNTKERSTFVVTLLVAMAFGFGALIV